MSRANPGPRRPRTPSSGHDYAPGCCATAAVCCACMRAPSRPRRGRSIPCVRQNWCSLLKSAGAPPPFFTRLGSAQRAPPSLCSVAHVRVRSARRQRRSHLFTKSRAWLHQAALHPRPRGRAAAVLHPDWFRAAPAVRTVQRSPCAPSQRAPPAPPPPSLTSWEKSILCE